MKDASRYLIVGLGGFIGANLRYIVGGWVQQRLGAGFPNGTFVINVTGCFILGCFSTLAFRFTWPDNLRLLIAIGFVGAYTTFSTSSYEPVRRREDGAGAEAALPVAGGLALGLAAAAAGRRPGAQALAEGT